MQSHISSNYLTSRIRTRNRGDQPLGPSNTSTANSNISSGVKQSGAQRWQIKMPITLAPGLFDFVLAISLVFGGCCTNAWTLERVLNETPSMGTTLSLLQMSFITAQGLPSVLQWNTPSWSLVPLPSLKPRKIPLSVWSVQVVLICTIATLNNLTFRYKLPLSIQIVLRSAGKPCSFLHFLWANPGTRAHRLNDPRVLFCLQKVQPNPTARGLSRNPWSDHDNDFQITLGCVTPSRRQRIRIGCNLPSVIASRFRDTWVIPRANVCQVRAPLEGGSVLYREYLRNIVGKSSTNWSCAQHAMSVPIISCMWTEIAEGWRSLATSSSSHTSFYGLNGLHAILAFNIITQAVCVTGVNNLTSQVSSVTTNLVLTARKAASLCLSIWWFGSGVSTRLAIGATCVFAGTVLYAQASSGPKPTTSSPSEEKMPEKSSS
ncbi:unnamed protein product [Rhizoctonia solani]|uniref:Sugar phosphate transporter domain-containing protein n=1 Tax=Rhizoctonia solani TaxID=456999 RepID=A0A8H2WG23_9AGAM|nr:unnamed protein product [Rhizoctonia solani]